MAGIHNAFGRAVKQKRWLITRADPLSPRPYSSYLTKNGLCGYRLERAATFRTEREAEEEAAYFRRVYPRFCWTVERV